MIEFLHGRMVSKNPASVVIECHGVGYFVNISLHTFQRLKDQESIKLLTHLAIREDAHVLYGFADENERRLFRLLISVSGIGAATALLVLSAYSPGEIQQAIAAGNAGMLQSIKGIGAKTAQRIIVDLKDKLVKGDFTSLPAGLNNTVRDEALIALVTLGFPRNSAEKVLGQLAHTTGKDATSVEQLVKLALKNL